MRWIEFSKIQKFWVGVKICLKMDIFNHSESAKDEIWQNPEYLSRVENLVKKWDFWPLRICKYEIGQNPEYLSCVENLAQKLSFLTTSFLGRLKFGKIQKFSVGSKNLIQNWDFLTTLDLRRMKFDKIQIFWVKLKIWLRNEIFNHFGPAKDEIWQNPGIFSHIENLVYKKLRKLPGLPLLFQRRAGHFINAWIKLSPTTNTLILDRPARFLFLALIQLQNILMKLSLTRKYPLIETLIYPTLTGIRTVLWMFMFAFVVYLSSFLLSVGVFTPVFTTIKI